MGKRMLWAGLVFLCLAASAAIGHANQGAWISILPPLLAVCFIYATKRLFLGLIVAILSGGFLFAWRDQQSTLPDGVSYFLNYFETSISDPWNLQVILFVFLVMAAVEVMVCSGGFQSIIDAISGYAKGKRMSQVLTSLMGVGLFFDDYVNTMVVGSGMRPLTDKAGVSRAKLAFLVDATAAPIAGLAVVSTWIGYEVGLFGKVATSLNLGVDGYGVFFDALGYRFYCMLMLAFVFLNVLIGRDFGPMLKAERAARPLHLPSNAGSVAKELSKITAVAVPIAVLLAAIFIGLWVDGDGQGTYFSLQNWREALASADSTVQIFALAAGLCLVAALFCTNVIADANFGEMSRSVWAGFRKAFVPSAILVLAWSLKAACDALQTGDYLASMLSENLPAMAFPAALFVISGVVAFSTGTSWGTMAILIPVAAPAGLALDGGTYGLITMMAMGAVLDGAIFGDHCSPISDTTILSSTASQCDHLEHVRTQLPYAMLVAGVALVAGYIPAAFGVSSWPLILVGVGMLAITLAVVGRPTMNAELEAENLASQKVVPSPNL